MAVGAFQYHTFLHHSQTSKYSCTVSLKFQYHTFLHHSQTARSCAGEHKGFSTIRFYIILKPKISLLSTKFVSVPYVFTSFSNCIMFWMVYIIVSVPYVFTSFSNLKFKNEPPSFAQNKVLKHI